MARQGYTVRNACRLPASLANTGSRDDIWAALKILTAQSSSATDNPRNELIILQALQDGDNDFVPWLHKAFLHHGPNGSHLCIVTDFLGPSLRQIVTSYYNWGERLEPDNILWLTSQLLEATALLHEAGIAHGGIYSYPPILPLSTHLLTYLTV